MELIALCLDAEDAAEWRQEHPELADAAQVVVASAAVGRGWSALRGLHPSGVSLGRRAALDPAIGGTGMPATMRLSIAVAEKRRPAYLKAVA